VALGVAVASTWASREEDEDEDVFLVFILAKRYEDWVWAAKWCWPWAAGGLLCRLLLDCLTGCCWAAWPGRPASSFSFISDFLFSVFYIVNLSAVLNSNILQTLLVEFK
jgi:hypothetical protein